ncbi:MAG: NIL domain-containing protein [Nitrospirota bacterium]
MASVKVHLTFPEDKIKEPIIFNVGHEFKVITNIRKADVREKKGWVDLEITGEATEIEKAVDSMKKKGVKVDPIEKNVIE